MRRRRRHLLLRPVALAFTSLALAMAGTGCRPVYAGSTGDPSPAFEAADTSPTPDERFAVHGQATYVEQDTDDFRAPYRGRNSLTPDMGRQTSDLTLFVGARLWRGAEFWISPEIDQGRGLDDTVGLAAFSSGEAYKVGSNAPYLRLPRLYVRQTLDTGGERENVEGAPISSPAPAAPTAGCSPSASSR